MEALAEQMIEDREMAIEMAEEVSENCKSKWKNYRHCKEIFLWFHVQSFDKFYSKWKYHDQPIIWWLKI